MYNFITAWDVIYELRKHGVVGINFTQETENEDLNSVAFITLDDNVLGTGPAFEDAATQVANRLISGDLKL